MGSTAEKLEKDVAHRLEVTKEAVEQQLTTLWDTLPSWLQDNAHIRSGYRPASGSFKGSAASLRYLHNETVNIYSHAIPSVLFAIAGPLFWIILLPRYERATQEDVYVFGCFFLGAMTCLGLSATYHTVLNHSEKIHKFGNKLDYLGIVFLIWGSFIPSIHYGFICAPNLIKSYWAMISTIGAGCAIVTTSSVFATPQWRPFRAAMFAAMGLSAVIPVLHGVNTYGLSRMEDLMGLRWVVLQGVLYVSGAAIYAMRVPERFKPGAFDLFGSSHQIFHVLVVLAALCHLTGLMKAFDYHHSHTMVEMCMIEPVQHPLASAIG